MQELLKHCGSRNHGDIALKVSQIMEGDVVKIVGNSAVMKPAFYIVVHHRRQCVVMGIRGTNTAQDVLTDLNPHSEPFEGG